MRRCIFKLLRIARPECHFDPAAESDLLRASALNSFFVDSLRVLEAGRLDHPRPLGRLGFDECGKLLRRAGDGFRALLDDGKWGLPSWNSEPIDMFHV